MNKEDLSYNIKLGLATNIKNKENFKIVINYIVELENENERLNNIIKEVRDFTKIGSMTYKHILGDFEVIEVESLLEILDKENK